jgi:hypothetical protein
MAIKTGLIKDKNGDTFFPQTDASLVIGLTLVNDLVNYYLKSEVYTKAEVAALIGAINQFHYEIAASTSAVTNPQSNVLYLIGPTGSGADKYEEYVYPNSTTGWVKIGDTSIDLSGYEQTTNRVTAVSAQSDNNHYPTAKAVWDAIVAGKEIFWVTYGTTTASEIATAISDGKLPCVQYSSRVYILALTDSSYYYFIAAQPDKISYLRQSRGNSSWIGGTNTFENTSDKVSTISGNETSTSKYPNTKAVADALALKYTKPNDGIPKSDLSAEVQSAIDNASITKLADQTFTFRKSPANSTRGRLNAVKGKSVVWNQLLDVQHIQGTGNGSYVSFGATQFQMVSGHKYLIKLSNWTNVAQVRVREPFIGSSVTSDTIFTASASGNCYFQWLAASGDSVDFYASCIDLTLLCTSGYEPSTVAEFEALYPLPYYAYDAGTIKSNAATAVEMVGRNQWDEEWENGVYDTITGEKAEDENKIRSKNKFPALPNTSYFVQCPSNATMQVFCFDASGELIKRWNGAYNFKGVTSPLAFTTPAGTHLMAFHITQATYNHDICINLSDASFNGQYEPYRKETLQLNIPTITGKLNGEGTSVTIFPDGLRQAGTAYDELVVDSDGWIRSAIKRVEMIDLGDESLTYHDYSTEATTAQPYGSSRITDLSTRASGKQLCCSKYINSASFTSSDKAVTGYATSSTFYIIDSSMMGYTAAQVKTAVTGAKLNYELATPLEYLLDTPIYVGFSALPGGTERRLPADTASSVIAPFRADFQYGLTEEEMRQDTTEIFWVTYGITTAAEIDAASAAGKLSMCWYNGKCYVISQDKSNDDFYFGCLYGRNGYLLRLSRNGTWTTGLTNFESTGDKVSSVAGYESNTTKYPSTKATYDAIHPSVATTQPSGGFLPNIVYDLGTLTGTVTFSLATPTDANIANAYHWTFETDTTAPTITWPANLVWAEGSAPTISASKHYEIMIRGHYANAIEFDLYVPAS